MQVEVWVETGKNGSRRGGNKGTQGPSLFFFPIRLLSQPGPSVTGSIKQLGNAGRTRLAPGYGVIGGKLNKWMPRKS